MSEVCIYCNKPIPLGFKKCFYCAMRRENSFKDWTPVENNFSTYPISQQSEEYKRMEFEGVQREFLLHSLPREWAEGYIANRIDMALITKNKSEFIYWTEVQKKYKEEVV